MTKTFKVKNKLLSTVEITVKEFSLTHIMHNVWQKFRESNCFTKDGTKELISRNICVEKGEMHDASMYYYLHIFKLNQF